MKYSFERRRRLTMADENFDIILKSHLDRNKTNIDIHSLANSPYESMIITISDHERAIMILNENKEIINVSPGWEDLCMYKSYEIIGKTPKILQGERTNRDKIRTFTDQIEVAGEAQTIIINYKKDNTTFYNQLLGVKIKPKYDYHYLDKNKVPAFIALLTEI